MSDILNVPSRKAQIGYNGFDMSQLNKFTSTVGELLPVYYDLLYPGDKVSVSSILKTRTMPLNSAAMVEIKEHIDWFAVPLRQLYQFFPEQFMNINDLRTSLAKASDFDNRYIFPMLSARRFHNSMFSLSQQNDEYFAQSVGLNIGSVVLKGTALRLMEMLNVPLRQLDALYDNVEEGHFKWPFAMNPMLFLAYQKIYFDYFRLSDRELNRPDAYNVDKFYNSPFMDSSNVSYPEWFKLRYRPWKKDFFTHTFVSPLFDIVGLNSLYAGGDDGEIVRNLFKQWLTDGLTDLTLGDPTGQNPNNPTQVVNPINPLDVGLAISPQAIRTSFAVNKFLEITRRAGKHLDKQILAHYGVDVPTVTNGEVVHIGHSCSSVQIGDVIATAETGVEGGALGRVGGKGYNYDQSKVFKYKNELDCPVILMAIYSAEPTADYLPLGLDKFYSYHIPGDFFLPSFDNLGMQPLFRYQARMTGADDSTHDNNDILGWQYRWMESKLKFNQLHGGLARSLRYWTNYREWFGTGLSHFLVNPTSLNTIMVLNYSFEAYKNGAMVNPVPGDYFEQNPSTLFDADPLLHEAYFNVKKASKMSSYGLEQL